MYSTCLHCHRSLGTNEVIEHFPVGERLAFDAWKGRLWVICQHCERWNLSPIEERWEAVEECEREFRAQRLRAQTDNVGLARVADGTELIRIGKPLRPEFAAWRYGGVFRRRLVKQMGIAAGLTTSLLGAAMVGGGMPAAAIAGQILMIPALAFGAVALRNRRNTGALGTRVIGEHGKVLDVTRENLDHTHIVAEADGAVRLHLRHSYGSQDLTGDRAGRALATLMLRVNRHGSLSGSIADAANFIADAGDPRRALAAVARESERRAGDFEERAAAIARGAHGRTMAEAVDAQMQLQVRSRTKLNWLPTSNPGALHRMPRLYRLALEMSLHESSEQFALEQELAALERDWREAEEIAAIADKLIPAPLPLTK
jgi:hypothetical protein